MQALLASDTGCTTCKSVCIAPLRSLGPEDLDGRLATENPTALEMRPDAAAGGIGKKVRGERRHLLIRGGMNPT